jgi:uncharacterized protein YukE
MADTNVDYQGVADGARTLRNVKSQLDGKVDQLKTMINTLINNGGFKTDRGSSALEGAATRFSQAQKKADEALDRMAAYLDEIPRLYQTADNQTASVFDRQQF